MHRYTISCALVALAATTGCSGVSDESDSTRSSVSTARVGQMSTGPFTATEVWDPFGLFQGVFSGGEQSIGNPPGGKLFCPGAPGAAPDPNTGLCPAGTRINLRDSVVDTLITEPTNPDLAGWVIVDNNSNWDEEGTGTNQSHWIWYLGATVASGIDADGTLEGTAEGTRIQGSAYDCTHSPFYPALHEVYPAPVPGLIDPAVCWIQQYKLVGRGTSGIADGLQIRMTLTAYTYQVTPFAFIASVAGQIVAP